MLSPKKLLISNALIFFLFLDLSIVTISIFQLIFSKFSELLTISILSILSNLLEKNSASLNSNKLLLIFTKSILISGPG